MLKGFRLEQFVHHQGMHYECTHETRVKKDDCTLGSARGRRRREYSASVARSLCGTQRVVRDRACESAAQPTGGGVLGWWRDRLPEVACAPAGRCKPVAHPPPVCLCALGMCSTRGWRGPCGRFWKASRMVLGLHWESRRPPVTTSLELSLERCLGTLTFVCTQLPFPSCGLPEVLDSSPIGSNLWLRWLGANGSCSQNRLEGPSWGKVDINVQMALNVLLPTQ